MNLNLKRGMRGNASDFYCRCTDCNYHSVISFIMSLKVILFLENLCTIVYWYQHRKRKQ